MGAGVLSQSVGKPFDGIAGLHLHQFGKKIRQNIPKLLLDVSAIQASVGRLSHREFQSERESAFVRSEVEKCENLRELRIEKSEEKMKGQWVSETNDFLKK